MSKVVDYIVAGLVGILIITACQESDFPEIASMRYLAPKYDEVSLMPGSDTLHFPLNDTTYNDIKSMNSFNDHGVDYLSFYDERSESVNIFNLTSQQLVKKILPKKYLPDKRLYKTTVYCWNFDSIFICNDQRKLYMLDSSGQIKGAAKFSDKPFINEARLDNSNPIVFKDSLVIASIRPSASITSLKKARAWRVMHQFNLIKKQKAQVYQLPVRYLNKFYDYHFHEYSYCINNNSRFVFSFLADSNLYETDLYYLHIAYFAKSQWQQDDITPVSKKDKQGDSGSRMYLTRDMYGAVYFDPFYKRYLRYFKKKINEPDFAAKKNDRKSTVLIFNENLQIIGETEWPDGVSFSTLFFTKDGRMYARVNRKDENALHFVRLMYKENERASSEVVKQETALTKENACYEK